MRLGAVNVDQLKAYMSDEECLQPGQPTRHVPKLQAAKAIIADLFSGEFAAAGKPPRLGRICERPDRRA